MSNWECGVCGYAHKEQDPPEKCPVCEGPAQMFKETSEEDKGASEDTGAPEDKGAPEDTGAPEDIGAPEDQKDAVEPEITAVEQAVTVKRWRCAVCGYVHSGKESPEKCPVCDAPKQMFQEIDVDGKALGELETEGLDPAVTLALQKGQKTSTTLLDKLANLSLKLHLHPITAHFPNGILPAVVVFLGLFVYFDILSLEIAAYYNLIFVLLMLPMVLLTGFVEWQKRYMGIKTAIFITKIICSLIVLGAVNVLVFWRLLDPEVLAEGSPSRLIYLGIAAGMLAVVGIAGHLGGKLVFGARG
jgi:rubredoxin